MFGPTKGWKRFQNDREAVGMTMVLNLQNYHRTTIDVVEVFVVLNGLNNKSYWIVELIIQKNLNEISLYKFAAFL